MGITGNWSERRMIQAGSGQWGSGWNPVHAVRSGEGRGTALQGNTDWVDPEIVDANYMYDYADMFASTVYGYGRDTGTSDRPGWTEEPNREYTDDFPSWGYHAAGVSGGSYVRSEDHGGETAYVSRNPMEENASAGWLNKQHTVVNQPVTSAPEQYEVATSMRQRDASRSGSQSSGRASEYSSPINSRPGAMKERAMVGDSERRRAMEPKVQIPRVRPWWPRQAGTGPRGWMAANETISTVPKVRQPPADPYQGPTVGATLTGWTDEDGGWY